MTAEHTTPAGPRARRFWSARRIPAALTAAVLLGASGLLLYDVVSVRADRPAMDWRRRFAHTLATQPIDDAWVVTGAAIAMAVGVWLVLLALTPGLRALLPMRRDDSQVRAGIDRRAAGLALRDRALEVAGVQAVRVRMKRRRVTVRAQAHFRPLDDVRADLDSALATGIDELGLARTPHPHVRVRRPRKKG